MYIDYDIRMFVGNFVLTMEETQEPPYTEEPQNPETFDANATLLFCGNSMLLAIIKKSRMCIMKKLILTTLLFLFVSSIISSHAVVHTIF